MLEKSIRDIPNQRGCIQMLIEQRTERSAEETTGQFGINADGRTINGNLHHLERELMCFQNVGFNCAEIPVHGVDVVRGGRLVRSQLEKVCTILEQFDLGYTVHGPNGLNLMNLPHLELMRDVFKASIEFTHYIGSQVLVYHGGRFIPEEEIRFSRGIEISPETIKLMRKAEVENLKELAEYAYNLGVEICVENARPFNYNILPCYAEKLDELIELVCEVDRENVGITLDVGHAYLSAKHYDFDLIEAIRSAKVHIRHVHLHDNFGRLVSADEARQIDIVPFGSGDLHMPPGWGEIPFKDIFSALNGYSGVYVLEIRPRYKGYYENALQFCKTLSRGKEGSDISLDRITEKEIEMTVEEFVQASSK